MGVKEIKLGHCPARERGSALKQGCYTSAAMGAARSSDKSSEPTPFQKFDALARRIIKVPKSILERRAKADKTKRERRKRIAR